MARLRLRVRVGPKRNSPPGTRAEGHDSATVNAELTCGVPDLAVR
jgi:hypothetical protein